MHTTASCLRRVKSSATITETYNDHNSCHSAVEASVPVEASEVAKYTFTKCCRHCSCIAAGTAVIELQALLHYSSLVRVQPVLQSIARQEARLAMRALLALLSDRRQANQQGTTQHQSATGHSTHVNCSFSKLLQLL
jgi:hypothetical protein